jgi:uncharacterized membrane protein YfcA
MDWSQIGTLIVAGTIGAWLGMMLSRFLKRRKLDKGNFSEKDLSQE